MMLWMCWAMASSGSAPRAEEGAKGEDPVLLPDVSHLVLSALVSADAVTDDAGVWIWEVSAAAGKGVTVQEFTSWVISTVPSLGNSLSRYVQDRFRSCQVDPVKVPMRATESIRSCGMCGSCISLTISPQLRGCPRFYKRLTMAR